jgi:hypothetical protein
MMLLPYSLAKMTHQRVISYSDAKTRTPFPEQSRYRDNKHIPNTVNI